MVVLTPALLPIPHSDENTSPIEVPTSPDINPWSTENTTRPSFPLVLVVFQKCQDGPHGKGSRDMLLGSAKVCQTLRSVQLCQSKCTHRAPTRHTSERTYWENLWYFELKSWKVSLDSSRGIRIWSMAA